jgi:hypothetical protein
VVDKPWETNRIWAYNSVVEPNSTHVFLYYHVFTAAEDPSMLCLAVSTDSGRSFYKPRLGLVSFNGTNESTNIVYFGLDFPGFGKTCGGGGCEPGAVFIDTNPKTLADEKFKLTVFGPAHGPGGVWPLVSPDGLQWKIASKQPIYLDSDTQQVFMYEPEPKPGKYVVYMRTKVLPVGLNRTCMFCVGESEARVDGLCKPHCGKGVHAIRGIGRCESQSFSSGWDGCSPQNASNVVFSFDKNDHACVDFYLSAATKYAPGHYLMFPPAYLHFPDEEYAAPRHWCCHNDGAAYGRGLY